MESAKNNYVCEEETRKELEAAYKTIAELTSMLDRVVGLIERLTDEKLRAAKEELCHERGNEIVALGSPYIDANGVMEMYGCSQAMAYKHLRAAGAASIGRKLIAKRKTLVDYANSIGLKQV